MHNWSLPTALVLAVPAGCRQPATQVLVQLDTDAPSDRPLSVQVTVRSGVSLEGAGRVEQWTRGGSSGSIDLPASFAIVPLPDQPRDSAVTVVVEADLAPGSALDTRLHFRRVARFRFVPRTRTSLSIVLATSCGNPATGCTTVPEPACTASVRCEEQGLTCGASGACIPQEVEPRISEPRGMDAGTPPAPGCDAHTSDASTACPEPTGTILADPAGAGGACLSPPAARPCATLLDFEDGVIPIAGQRLGFFAMDVADAVVTQPGAGGTTTAAEFTMRERGLFVQHLCRRRYLYGSSEYQPYRANALEFYVRLPTTSPLLAAGGDTLFSVRTWHWRPYDPWVGPNPTGANLTDSQSLAGTAMRFDPGAAGRWVRVVLSASAFRAGFGLPDFFAAQATTEDATYFGSVRQIHLGHEPRRAEAPVVVGLDEVRLVTVPPTARVCPSYVRRDVPSRGGDVAVPIEVANPTATPRTYRVFASSAITLDRLEGERVVHDTDELPAFVSLVAELGGGSGAGVVELFAVDGAGNPVGPSVVDAAVGITVAPGGSWRGVLVHHVAAEMLGPSQNVMYGGRAFTLQRDTLLSSVMIWDPAEPRLSDPAVQPVRPTPVVSRAPPPGFPQPRELAPGWRIADVPADQVGAYFVSSLRLRP